jgi:hypothetical protein
MSMLLTDLRYGLRMLAKNPGLTAVAVLSLAVGIGANTTVFSWIDGFLFRPVSGVPKNEELVSLQSLAPSGDYIGTSYPDYKDYRDQSALLSGVVAYKCSAVCIACRSPCVVSNHRAIGVVSSDTCIHSSNS